MKKATLILALLAATLGVGCTTYVRPPAPPVRVEVKPARPHGKAVWAPGHWKWKNRRVGYVWVKGHWKHK